MTDGVCSNTKKCYFCNQMYPAEIEFLNKVQVTISDHLSVIHIQHGLICQKCWNEWFVEAQIEASNTKAVPPNDYSYIS